MVELLRGLVAGEPGLPACCRTRWCPGWCGPEIEELLCAAAVLGATVDPDTVAALLERSLAATGRACERTVAAKLLVVAGREYEFANDLMHELLYATTPASTRRSLHRRGVDLLIDRPEAVAAHAAALEDWPRAVAPD